MKLKWQCGRFELDCERPMVMGVLNVTPDSFSDGGDYERVDWAIEKAKQMHLDGANIIDIGGESTRPYADAVSACCELSRIIPVLEGLRELNIPISIDTKKPYVMREALRYGADIINDVNGFRTAVALDAIVDSECGLCIMHMQGSPKDMQDRPTYADPVTEVGAFLKDQRQRLIDIGVAPNRMCFDPGIGFGKTKSHNIALVNQSGQLSLDQQVPILVGLSRKSVLGEIISQPDPKQRVFASVAAALYALQLGAHIVRVHDVKETVDAIKVWQAFSNDAA